MVCSNKFFSRAIEVQNTLININNVLHKRHFKVKPGLINHPSWITKLQNKCLLGLVNSEKGCRRQKSEHGNNDKSNNKFWLRHY